MRLATAIRTCIACPSQWDAQDDEGQYWYLRFRHGKGTAERQPSPDVKTWTTRKAEFYFTTREHDGYIELNEFCRLAGIEIGNCEEVVRNDPAYGDLSTW